MPAVTRGYPSLLLGLCVAVTPAVLHAELDEASPASRPTAATMDEVDLPASRPTVATTNDEPSVAESFSHFMQLGLRASLLGGYRMVFRYDESPFCAEPDFSESLDDQQKFCGHLGPAMLDLAVSFAPIGIIEPFAMVRLGLVGEGPTDTKPLRMVALGARIYSGSERALKLFLEPSLGLELEAGGGDPDWSYNGAFEPQYSQDVVFRIALGPQLDLARNVGLYVQAFGMSVGILRYIHGTLEFGGGVQVRLP